ncbi:MAG: ribonuclease Y [Victivallales bacterium]|nr:ribonuclease Y [Victivallales bacterium]
MLNTYFFNVLCFADSLSTANTPEAVNRIQLWLVTGGVLALLILVIFQTVTESRRHRKTVGDEKKAAENEADRIRANAAQQAETEAERIIAIAQEKAKHLKEQATQQIEVLMKDAQLRAQQTVIAAKDAFEASLSERRQELARNEARLAQKEDNVENKLTQLQERLNDLDRREAANRQIIDQLAQREQELNDLESRQLEELHNIAGMSLEQARQQLLERLENTLQTERSQLIRRYQEENRQMLMRQGQKIMVEAMQRYAGDCTYDRTTSLVPLPNDEMKGRIIGREGRNIRTIEAATGASILIDDTPQAVVISCFDPVRREIARQTMEKLVQDGRIHPARVEEIVNKIRKEIEASIQKSGQEAVESLGINSLRQNLIVLLGRLKYRFSFGQNVLSHSIEVATMMGAIAADIGLDERLARRAGLLHDIGKAVDHEVEGSHAIIGADLLQRAGEDPVVVNAVAAHHEETEKTSLFAELVQICDTISAGRPGARAETTELYLKRLEDLEKIGNSFAGVESCYAIQAGRELRVLVRPEKVSEAQAVILAHDLAERIEKEMRYPGQIRVSVIRETRAVEYAK